MFAFFSGNGSNEQANNESPYGWQCDSFFINLLTSSRLTRLLSLSCSEVDETTVFATNIVTRRQEENLRQIQKSILVQSVKDHVMNKD